MTDIFKQSIYHVSKKGDPDIHKSQNEHASKTSETGFGYSSANSKNQYARPYTIATFQG